MSALDQLSVLPWWAARELDVRNIEFFPADAGAAPSNRVHRRWSMVGNLFAWDRALVDPCGLLSPDGIGWSLDWWVGAEDGWHVPSAADGVRQQLIDDTPVIETRLRVPGGDIIHRVVGAQVTGFGASGVAMVEVENRSAVPVALALAVRPYGLIEAATVHSIDLDGAAVKVNGQLAFVCSRPPLHSTGGDGPTDVADVVRAGEASVQWDGPVTSADGTAQAAFVFPLAHTAVLRIVVPLGALPDSVDSPAFPEALPASAQVAAGWATQRGRGARFELPPSTFSTAIDANRAWLLLFAGGEDIVTRPERLCDLAETADVLGALGAFGYHDEVDAIVRTWPERQRLDGAFVGVDGRLDANGAALAAAARHAYLSGDIESVAELVGTLAKGAKWLTKRASSRRGVRLPGTTGLLPAGSAPDWLAAPDTTAQWYRDDAWAVRGLLDVAGVFDVLGQPEAAADARTAGRDLLGALEASIAPVAGVLAAGPGRAADATVVGSLEVARLLLDDASVISERLGAALVLVPSAVARLATAHGLPPVLHRPGGEGGVAGFSAARTAELALLEVLVGDDIALDRLEWLLAAGGATRSWPTVAHPLTGHGVGGEGQHALAAARFLTLARTMVVHEHGGGLDLCPAMPASWLGKSLEVHDLPTRFGRLAFALRWYDDRPALLWDLEPHAGVVVPASFELRAPGLDRAWSSTAPKGDAVLSPVKLPVQGGVTMPVTLGRRPQAPDAAT